jgi:heme-degrading monooxygenase HmoA
MTPPKIQRNTVKYTAKRHLVSYLEKHKTRRTEMDKNARPGVLLIVRFKSSLSADELKRRYKERLPKFRALPGLLQKHYLHDPVSGEWAGLYLWDSQESLDEFMASDLRKTIPETYQFAGTPRIETLNVIDTLRE